jgi:putative transposase
MKLPASMKSGTPWVPTQVKQWKKQLQEGGTDVFSERGQKVAEAQADVEANLYEQIGRLKMELEWLKKKVA